MATASARLRKPAAHAAPPLHPSEAAAYARLRYVSDTAPGIVRVRAGRGFRYQTADGKPSPGDPDRVSPVVPRSGLEIIVAASLAPGPIASTRRGRGAALSREGNESRGSMTSTGAGD